ncbi:MULTISPECIES: uracil-DNA glycosylase [unclassified Tolypothrix]|uniref:uracil-DNA glycosylase n=1 Tax=unclassified Tolypothrix TaxID=2649714 RepID=UPI0005EAC25D|nr:MULTISPECIES: uracil-DNA glycosylase [unclassified Tolypothrix]BAY94139.1 hypothetical protein NIES3275_61840 [Microchaete diplosiphon NIES-3275]EKF03802.1 hypothetical protein FDUTEX481_02211 [Tolypothrix sp. PCC 7601]MBE9086864.1 uracil-DNA glycosylase [Tolypothrix sp. LEGE 11397]UYD27892.1 uracil-DNA glycosylase [Tolypothrix sp. PCC 7712]UYD36241.1 uracil-DNA glycosylase [Tolypothrix sp. PCC 7601]
MPEYLFSQFKDNEFEALHRELSKVFDIPQVKLQDLYAVMQQEFEVEGYPEHKLTRNIFHSFDESFKTRYEESFVIGVDIPSILEKNNSVLNKKTIAIIGQDPLRKSKVRLEKIGIATPYALHLQNCRKRSRYFDLIKVLLDEGYRVYLTDIFKIWVSEANSDRGIPLSKKDRTQFIQILKTELEIFEPLAVVTWGNVASSTVRNINLNIKHLEFPHPSGAANATWRKIMRKPATRENRINFWQEKVLSYLSGF